MDIYEILNKISINKITHFFRRWRFGTKQQLSFLEDLYLLINDGIPANRAVEMMAQVSTGITKEVAQYMTAKIAEGQPLAEGMSEWFNTNVVEVVRVGESGGALGQTMKSAINMLSQQGVAIGAFVGALAYPLVVLIIACAVILYLDSSVFAQFQLIKPMDQWPEAGKRLVAVAGLIKNFWWTVIVAVLVVGVILKWLMSHYIGVLRPKLDQVPPFLFYRRLIAARLLETLGLLVSNGVVFKSAIKVMQYQANPYFLSHLVKMEHLLSMGKTNLADVLDTGLIDSQDLMRLRVMAEVKGFEHGLIRMGLRGAEKATATLKLIARIFGGTFLILGGLMIIMIIQGIYLTGMSLAT